MDPSTIHMPSPSFWPLVVAFGVAILGAGILTHVGLSFVGGAIAFIGAVGWANEPAAAEATHH